MKSVIGSFLALSLVLLFAVSAIAADISLSVAASLREVVTELSDGFAKSHAGVRFQNNFGASGVLAKQIENGGPADIFFSANLEWMDYLKEERRLDEKSISTFAYNVLVFVGKPESKIMGPQDVVKPGKIAIGSPKSVRAGEYAVQAFKKAGIV
jgi:molybdate transport system substrate-binding protein